MIKAEKNKIYLKGNDIDLLSELTLIVKSLNEQLTKEFEDEGQAKGLIEEAVRIAFLSDEEKHKEVMDILMGDRLERILEKLEGMFK